MSKRIMIGLFALSVVAVLRTEANAGCAVIAGFQICASWITGGSEVGLVTAQGFGDVAQSCQVVTTQGQPAPCPYETCITPSVQQVGAAAPVELRLVGTIRDPSVSRPCGLGATDNEFCDIRGAVFCGPSLPPAILTLPLGALTTSTTTFGWPDGVDEDDDKDHPRARRVTTPGPLRASADSLGQVDGSGRNFAGFRFQISPTEQRNLCPGREFVTFIAREGFFEACIVDARCPGGQCCIRERCTVNTDSIGPDDPRVYRCQPVSS